MGCMDIDFQGLRWESDWSGDEVGHDGVNIVGLYYSEERKTSYYINMETFKVLEAWEDEDD